VTRGRRSIGAALLAAMAALPVAAAAQSTSAKPAPSSKPAPTAKATPPATAGQPLAQSQSRERNLRAYVELMRADLRAEKVAIITQVMGFTEAEDKAFWPVYRQYENELAKINDERLQGIEQYGKTFTSLTDATANDLMTKALDLEARRTALLQKYYTNLKTAVSPLTAARALQVERQILLLLDLQVAASLPVVE